MTTEDRLRTFITDELRWDGREMLSDDYPLIQRGVIDSLGILSLVTYIEDSFGVLIEDEDLVPEHFGTISSMARLVAQKGGGAS